MIQGSAGFLGIWQLTVSVAEHLGRGPVYDDARRTADLLGLPLLNVGCPGNGLLSPHPCGDVCIDLDPGRLACCRSAHPILADVRDIPYRDGYFGATMASHVLEHMLTVEDAKQALSELVRVSQGRVFIAYPSKLNPMAWFHPDHHLWVIETPEGLVFEQR